MDLGIASLASGALQTAEDVWRVGRASDEATFQRNWTEQMYGKRYQMQMEDMRKAGLNPLLAATEGAPGVGSGATADVPSVSNPLQTAMEMKLMSAQRDAAVGTAAASSASASKAQAEAYGQSLTNKQIEESIPFYVRKAKAEVTSAEGLSKVDKAAGDLYDKLGSGGKGIKEFMPLILEFLRPRR